MIIGTFTELVPPAARTLSVIVSVYGIILAAKKSPWMGQYITGWISVAINIAITILGLLVVIPADQLYSWNTLVAIVVTVLGSSGIHGMVQNIPPTKE